MNNDNALSERAYITKQYAQRAVKGGTHRTTACVAGAPYKHCHPFWFAPQTGHWHCGASLHILHSSLRLLPIYVSSLRERFVIYNFIFLSFLSFYLFIINH